VRREGLHEALDPLVGHVEDDQLLLRRRPDAPLPVLVGEVGDAGEQRAADPAGAQREADGVGAVLLPGDADVVALVVLGRGGAGPSGSSSCRYSSSSTCRNFSGPQSAMRNLMRARLRCRR
jgi:hypothetical protein